MPISRSSARAQGQRPAAGSPSAAALQQASRGPGQGRAAGGVNNKGASFCSRRPGAGVVGAERSAGGAQKEAEE